MNFWLLAFVLQICIFLFLIPRDWLWTKQSAPAPATEMCIIYINPRMYIDRYIQLIEVSNDMNSLASLWDKEHSFIIKMAIIY